jgi:hypothetical protein
MKFAHILRVWRVAEERCIECTLRLSVANSRAHPSVISMVKKMIPNITDKRFDPRKFIDREFEQEIFEELLMFTDISRILAIREGAHNEPLVQCRRSL